MLNSSPKKSKYESNSILSNSIDFNEEISPES